MTQCKTLNAKLSNWQLNKLKYGIKRGTEVTLMGNSMMKPVFHINYH